MSTEHTEKNWADRYPGKLDPNFIISNTQHLEAFLLANYGGVVNDQTLTAAAEALRDVLYWSVPPPPNPNVVKLIEQVKKDREDAAKYRQKDAWNENSTPRSHSERQRQQEAVEAARVAEAQDINGPIWKQVNEAARLQCENIVRNYQLTTGAGRIDHAKTAERRKGLAGIRCTLNQRDAEGRVVVHWVKTLDLLKEALKGFDIVDARVMR
jgi:hypothetical protein